MCEGCGKEIQVGSPFVFGYNPGILDGKYVWHVRCAVKHKEADGVGVKKMDSADEGWVRNAF